ncbi:protein-tyrosine phosphatase family protein [Leisingera sp. McT4-56]|uniref:protein-tyrosine phosphatase family protein n=1 Tax=Leisingera sp. McT4-56 TaxID=2881255 RepID=UPI001CF8AD09|nr:protein-tyrosine phosphatase family protein [Leisingera sp. McT4-56]MCB4456658.1 protein phosphatase [Leisingera sp. McT4-56]
MRTEDTSKPAVQETAAQAGLTIHALSAGGGILALCRLPGGEGDYRSDLIQIYQWRPGLVISMTTEAEHVAAGVPRLGVDIQSMASRWIHLPVPDFQVPPPGVNAKWAAASKSARQALAGGGRVLVHCRGGCGRSGMAVMRLMIECGEDPAQALARLRSVRPCAVETDEQLDWACDGSKAC